MSWRRRFPVLVVQAETLGSLAVIRSLGRAGYPVHACSADPAALGLRSRWAAASAVCPRYSEEGFLPWLRRYASEGGLRAIVPSESLLLALRPAFAELAPLLTCGPDEEVVLAGMSKHDQLASLLSAPAGDPAGEHLPPTLLVPFSGQPPPSAARLQALGPPLYVKVDAVHARFGGDEARSDVFRVESGEQARVLLAGLSATFRKALVQGEVRGRGVGASFLLRRGEVLAELMHRRLHEVPHTGGASSLRESFFHRGIRDDALAKLRRLRWEGVAMMEYRLDERTGDWRFLEMNGRFWGSLHLALHAGVDFPALLLDAFFGCARDPVRRWRQGVRCRHLPGEVQHVWTRLKDPGQGIAGRALAVAGLLAHGLDPRVRADLLFPGDRALYWEGLRQAWRELGGAAARRLRGNHGAQAGAQAGRAGGSQALGAVPGLPPPDPAGPANPLLPRDRHGG